MARPDCQGHPARRFPATAEMRNGEVAHPRNDWYGSTNLDVLGKSQMRYVTASEAKQRFAAVIDAVQREPVTVRRQSREVAVLLSPADYKRLTNANVEEFRRFCDRVSRTARARGMTEESLAKLLDD